MNVNSDIANSTDERTVDFEWAIPNQHNIAASRLHTINFFTGLGTPLTASFGQDHCGKSSEFVNMLTEKHGFQLQLQ